MKSLLFFLVTLLAMAFTRVCLAGLSVEACDAVFSATIENSSRSTEIYLNLFRALAKNKNALTVDDFATMSSHGEGVNPFQIIKPTLSSEDSFAFEKAFERLLKNLRVNPLDWSKIKAELEVMAKEKKISEMDRGRARAETETIFAPVLRDEFKDSKGNGWLGDTFRLQDGSLMAVLKDGPGVFLFDVKQERKIGVVGDGFSLSGAFKNHQRNTGSTLFAAYRSDQLMVYEISQDHLVTKIKDFERVFPGQFTNGLSINLEDSYLTESPLGGQAILEIVLGRNLETNQQEIEGYLEVEIETGNKRYFPTPTLENEKLRVAANNHLLSYTLNTSKEMVVRDLTTDKVLNRIPLPVPYRKIFTIESFSNDGSDKIFMTTSSYLGGGSLNLDRWIYFDSGKSFDLTEKIKRVSSTEIISKKGSDYQIIREDHFLDSIAVFDQSDESFNVLHLPGNLGATETSLLKLQNGKSILFVGSDQKLNSGSFLYWVPLEKGAVVNKMSLFDRDIKRLREVYETADGRIEAFFETDGGYKIFQVFGPLDKAGAI